MGALLMQVKENKDREEIFLNKMLRISILNLFLVAASGLLLRMFPFAFIPLEFKNLLHGHSHFAFGGWVFPVLLTLMLQNVPLFRQHTSFRSWKKLYLVFLVAAYGMLFTFPFMGYKAPSILFSTLSVAGSFYMARLVLKATASSPDPFMKLFRWAMIFAMISAAGPLLTGPLIASGMQGTPLYFNAVYFYLHFLFNGAFLLIVAGIAGWKYLQHASHRRKILFNRLLLASVVLTFALSLLWSYPYFMLYLAGGIGGLLQMGALFVFYKMIPPGHRKHPAPFAAFLFSLFILKVIIQAAIALPAVSLHGLQNRNFIIAFLHLALLGCISLFALREVHQIQAKNKLWRKGLVLFIAGFLLTELLLVTQASLAVLHHPLTGFNVMILGAGIFLALGAFLLFIAMLSGNLPFLQQKEQAAAVLEPGKTYVIREKSPIPVQA